MHPLSYHIFADLGFMLDRQIPLEAERLLRRHHAAKQCLANECVSVVTIASPSGLSMSVKLALPFYDLCGVRHVQAISTVGKGRRGAPFLW